MLFYYLLIKTSLDNQNPNQENNIDQLNEYQNSTKLQKQDENGPGVSVSNNKNGSLFMNHSFQIMQDYGRSNQSEEDRQQTTGNFIQIPLQNMPGDNLKHGTSGDSPQDPRSMLPGMSHAQNRYENVHASESKDNDSDDCFSDDPKSRTSASSRVNFSKLTAEEKERRWHNMSKEVKQLRRKIRNMEERIARSSNCTDFRTGSTGMEPASIDSLVQRAKEKIKGFNAYELSDQKDLIENLWMVISQGRLKTDSLAYYMIWTLVRGYLTSEEQANYENSADQNKEENEEGTGLENKEILVSFPEKEVRISK